MILRVFERDVARAERMDQRILESDISSMEREIVDLEEQARILKETRDTLIPAEETIRRLNSLYQMGYKEDSSGYVPSGLVVSNPASRERVANAVKWEEKKIQDIKDNIEVLETELVKIRAQWFSGKAEKAKNDEITNLRSKLLLLEPREGESAELEKKKADLAAWDAAAAIIKGKESAYTPSYMLTRSLTDIETRFLQKKHELSVLQRGLLKKD